MPISNRTTSDTLTAAHYNELRNKIVQILGVGASDYGYGQGTISTTVAGSSTQQVNAQHMANLRTDIVKAYVHITSSAFNVTTPTANSSIILATASGATYNETHNSYISAINYCEANRFIANPSQMTLVTSTVPKTVGSNWNGTVTVSHTVSFASAEHQRFFFNAGGQIRFYAAHDTNSTGKSSDWQQFLANKINGTIYYAPHYWAAKNGTSAYSLQQNAGSVSSAYSDNYWRLNTTFPNATDVQITQEYADADIGDYAGGNNRYWIAAYDENVIGTTTTDVGYYFPTGVTTDPVLGTINTVQVNAPTVT